MRLPPDGALRIVHRALVERAGALRIVQGALVVAGWGARYYVIMDGLPKAFDESISALHSLIGPFEGLFGGRREHREQARGVRPEFVDQRLRIDAVVLRLRHGHHAAGLHRKSVGAENRA